MSKDQRIRAAAFVLLAAAFACGQKPKQQPTLVAPPLGEPTAYNTPSPTSTVSGVRSLLHVSAVDGGVQSTPVDLSSLPIFAELDGGAVRLIGSGTREGTFAIDNVPDDLFVLSVGASHYLTDARSVNLSAPVVGRADAVPVTQPTPVSVQFSNFAPLAQSDVVEAIGLNDRALSFSFQQLVTLPDGGSAFTPGAGNLDGQVDWRQMGAEISPSAGDTLFLSQLSEQDLDGGQQWSMVRFADLSGVPVTQGASNGIAAVLQIPPSDPFSFAVERTTNFESAYPSDAVFQSLLVDVAALPRASSFGFYDNAPDLYFAQTTDPTVRHFQMQSTLPRVYPAAWDPFVVVQMRWQTHVTVDPGQGGSRPVMHGYDAVLPLAGLPADFSPTLSPPANVKVNGKSIASDIANAGLTPVVSWDPPSSGKAALYRVVVWKLAYDATAHTVSMTSVHHISLPPLFTSYVLPTGLLETGGSYVVEVDAFSAPDFDAYSAPVTFALPTEDTFICSHLVRP